MYSCKSPGFQKYSLLISRFSVRVRGGSPPVPVSKKRRLPRAASSTPEIWTFHCTQIRAVAVFCFIRLRDIRCARNHSTERTPTAGAPTWTSKDVVLVGRHGPLGCTRILWRLAAAPSRSDGPDPARPRCANRRQPALGAGLGVGRLTTDCRAAPGAAPSVARGARPGARTGDCGSAGAVDRGRARVRTDAHAI